MCYCLTCDDVVTLVFRSENTFAARCIRCGRSPGPRERELSEYPDADTRDELKRIYHVDD